MKTFDEHLDNIAEELIRIEKCYQKFMEQVIQTIFGLIMISGLVWFVWKVVSLIARVLL